MPFLEYGGERKWIYERTVYLDEKSGPPTYILIVKWIGGWERDIKVDNVEKPIRDIKCVLYCLSIG